MKIIVSTKSFYPLLGGSIVFAEMMAEAFTRAGHEVILITRTPGTSLIPTEYKILRQPSFYCLIKLAKWADVVLQVDASWRDVIPFLLHNVPWVPTVHRGKPPYRGLGVRQRLLLAIESAGYRVGNTIGVADYVIKNWKIKSPAIPNPYNDLCYRAPESNAIRDIDILFVGRITRDKGVFVLLEALKILGNSGVRRKIVFVGIGPALDELRMASEAMENDYDFFFPGLEVSNAVATWMRRSKVLAFPTTPDWLEASPLTPLEAAACGCKVVAANIGGTIENVSSSHWLVKSGCVESLVQGLIDALDSDLGKIDQETKRFLADRTLDHIADRYLNHFISLGDIRVK